MKVYVFKGMYNGVVNKIKIFEKEKEAIEAWERFTESKWGHHNRYSAILPDPIYAGSTISKSTLSDLLT